jgi:hypothetical protein
VASWDADGVRGGLLERGRSAVGAVAAGEEVEGRENRDKLEAGQCRMLGGLRVHLMIRVQEQHASGLSSGTRLRPEGRGGPWRAMACACSSGQIAGKLAEAVVDNERNCRRRRLELSLTTNRQGQADWVSWS